MIVYEIPKSSPLYVKDNVFINFISDSLFVVLSVFLPKHIPLCYC